MLERGKYTFLAISISLLSIFTIECRAYDNPQPEKRESRNPEIIGLKFGSSIDSVYRVIKERYGEDKIIPQEGGYNESVPAASPDSTLVLDRQILIFPDQQKTASYTFLNFQKDSKGQLVLFQVYMYLNTAIPWDWENLLPKIYQSYFDYLAPQYPDDYEELIKDDGLPVFRFGKAKYSPVSWYGLFEIKRLSKGYATCLVYTVPPKSGITLSGLLGVDNN